MGEAIRFGGYLGLALVVGGLALAYGASRVFGGPLAIETGFVAAALGDVLLVLEAVRLSVVGPGSRLRVLGMVVVLLHLLVILPYVGVGLTLNGGAFPA
jgi:hypothetical protein